MATKFPKKLQVLLDDAVRHLWDPKYPKPDLCPLIDFLENGAWDDVVNAIVGGFIDRDSVVEFMDDAILVDHIDVDEKTGITDGYRINFARGRLDSLIEESMYSIHVIDVESKNMPPASLGIMMYYHGQGGAHFYDISVCHSPQDYLASLKPETILEQGDLRDEDILKRWKKRVSGF